MEFDTSYYEDEVREGFYIPGMIKRSWAVQLDILELIAKICEKHKINWYAEAGTLIGAVRHRGFIPWDDDLDIFMMRNDYNRFMEIVKEEIPEGYGVLNLQNEPEYEHFLTRITNGKVINMNVSYLMENHGFPYVAGVDIFPLDYLIPDEEKEEERRLKAKTVWDLVLNIKEGNEKRSEEEIIDFVENLSGHFVDRSLPLAAALLRTIESIFAEYSGENSEYVALMPYWIVQKNHKYPLSYYKEFIELPFEMTHINVPAAYAEVLKIEYGNWECVNKKGGVHEYPFYKEQEKILFETQGKVPYRYQFSGTEEFKNEGRTKHALEADVNAKIFQMLGKVQELVFKAIDMKADAAAMSSLEQCQELAIKVGTNIEEEQGEGLLTVELLEQYCEQVYQLHERISAGEVVDTEQESEKFSITLRNIQNSYKNDVKRKKEVWFLPVKAEDWAFMEAWYRAAKEDPKVDAYVMPVPYAERKSDGNMGAEHFDLTEFPSDLDVVDYRTYDFAHKHPDVMIIQNPFDEYASGMTVHPFFYAKNLKQYTEQLVYIPCFEVDELDPEDEKSIANSVSYIVTPGVIHSDRIIVSSENLKKRYVECLTEVTGETCKEEWEKKILVGSELINQAFEEKMESYEDAEKQGTACENERQGYHQDRKKQEYTYNNKKDVKCKLSQKKKVLFYMGFSDFYTGGKKAILKLKNVLELFASQKDEIRILWLSEDSLESNLEKLCPQIYEDYRDILTFFEQEQMGERVSMSEIKKAVSQADAFYGSGGYAMNLCVRKKIPVMLKTMEVI